MRALYRDRLVAEYDLADYLLVPSSYVAETMIRSGIGAEKVFVLPYGVDTSFLSSQERRLEQAEEKHSFRILFVGQVLPLKGVHYLVQALENMKIPNVELIIIGNGDTGYLKLLNGLIPPGISVQFKSHIPHMELKQYYSGSDVLVLPSLSDSFGLVVSEAMMAGLPVIVSENTGAKEIIRDGVDGFIVPIRDANALQEKLMYLYERPQERQIMGCASMERVNEFSWDHYKDRLLAVYDQILIQKGN